MAAEVIRILGQAGELDQVRRAARIVDEGGLVAFPTETVYGVACRVAPNALARLDRIKGRTADKHYTLHIGQADEYRRYVSGIDPRAEKLIHRAWPGPLTVVFRVSEEHIAEHVRRIGAPAGESLYKNGSIGIRCPDQATASLLLRMVESPVVAPSANRTGHEPPTNAEQVLEELGDDVDLVLDAGPCKYSKSSTVATCDEHGLRVLREGVYSRADLKAMSTILILCVCTGNTCRSPMAEGIFRKVLAQKLGCRIDNLGDLGYKITSAGTMDMPGMPASDEAIRACQAKGVDLTDHASQRLSRALVEASDYIFGMTRAHCQQVVLLSADARAKCHLLAADIEIPDPIGQPQEFFNKCADAIEMAVKSRISELV
jgi:protein-tyrosine phosphatase